MGTLSILPYFANRMRSAVKESVAVSKKPALIGLLSLVYVGAVVYIVDLGKLAVSLQRIPASALLAAFALVIAANLFALARSGAVLKTLDFPPPWRALYLAFSASGIANLPLNVIGQSLTRAVVLRNVGIPFSVTVTATYVERLLAAGLLFLFSLVSAWYLFGVIHVDFRQAAEVFTTVAGIATVAAVAALTIFRRSVVAGGAVFVRWVPKLTPAAVLTILGHGAGLGAYLVLLCELDPHGVSTSLAAAIVIVMLVTALPISFAGWGLRELSAASAFAPVGIAPEVSVAAALMIGLLYLMATGLFAAAGVPLRAGAAGPCAAGHQGDPPAEHRTTHRENWDSRAVRGCAMACALLILFRVPTAFGSGGAPVNVNIADVVVFLALGVIVLMMAAGRLRSLLPPALTAACAAVSCLLVLGLLVSWGRENLGNWAIYTRGVGWVLMLGYAALGAAMVRIAGEEGRLLIVRTLVVAALTVCTLQLAALAFSALVVPVPRYVLAYPFQGFANNQNAFAFELAMIAVLLIAGHALGALGPRAFGAAVAVVAVTVYFTGSRTGAVFIIALAFFDWIWSRLSATQWRRATLYAAVTIVTAMLLPYAALLASPMLESVFGIEVDTEMLFAVLAHPAQRINPANTLLFHPSADIERWQTILGGLTLWRESPLLGAGLGAYVQSVLAAGEPLHGIHSVYIWFLAEMGVVGLVALLGMGALVASRAWRRATLEPPKPWGWAVLAILAFMALGGLVQDFFYQRIFWFALGLAAARHDGIESRTHDRIFLATVAGFGLIVFVLAL